MPADRVSLATAMERLGAYREAYWAAWRALVADMPGGALPPPASPYTSAGRLECLVLNDALLLMGCSDGPAGHWYITGGPAVKVDYAQTRTPLQVRVMLGRRGPDRPVEGIVRAIAPESLPVDVWHGLLGEPQARGVWTWDERVEIRGTQYEFGWREALRRSSFGFFGDIAPFPTPVADDQGALEVVRGLGFLPADLSARRFFDHLRIAAWIVQPDGGSEDLHQRAARHEVARDVRRTWASGCFRAGDVFKQLAGPAIWSTRFQERLAALETAMRNRQRDTAHVAAGARTTGTTASDGSLDALHHQRRLLIRVQDTTGG